jgi:hypothetical protein
MIRASNNPFECTPVIINPGGNEPVLPYGVFRFIKKGFGNSGEPGEEGDVYEGWVSENVYSPHAIYDGSGPLNDPESFEHKQLIEY